MRRMVDKSPSAPLRVADAPSGNWVDRWAPVFVQPYLKLARLDRPVGTWLLLLPCWWSLALASATTGRGLPDPWLFLLFGAGAVVMRGAGCTLNDIADRDFDASVERTCSRPLPSGQVTLSQAILFMGLLAAIGLLVLLQFNRTTIALGVLSLLLVMVYPFMKRVTYWPQFFLGLAFNWGALMGWSAVTGALSPAALALYAGGIAWTIGYDTIYAHQDKEDDALIGLKSTALRFGRHTSRWLAGFYALAVACFVLAAGLSGARWPAFAGIGLMGAHFIWQLRQLDTDDGATCLRLFRANRDAGLVVLAGYLLAGLLPGLSGGGL